MRMRNIWRNIVTVCCVAAIALSGCWIVYSLNASSQAEESYEALAELMGPNASAAPEPTAPPPTFDEWFIARVAEAEEEPETTPEASALPEESAAPATSGQLEDAEARAADEGAAVEKYAQVLPYVKGLDIDLQETLLKLEYYRFLEDNGYERPSDAEELEQSLLMDFSALASINPDVVGWLLCPDTVINYPVVSGVDNDYYLYHLFDGTQNAAGTLFCDMYNERTFTDRNTIIYGHNMRSGSMFASIARYKEQQYYDEHPALILYTPGATYLVELFAGYVEGDVSIDLPCYQMVYKNDDVFMSFVTDSIERSTFVSDIEICADDRIVTFSTCTYEVYNARYIVHGKLTLIAGEEPVAAYEEEE